MVTRSKEANLSDLFPIKSIRQPSPGAMAPTTTIETITITRPLKVIAFICGIVVIVLMILALTSTEWLLAAGWRQGLFVHCVTIEAEPPLPFNIVADVGCYESRDACEFLQPSIYENSITDFPHRSLHKSDRYSLRDHAHHRCHLDALDGNWS